MLISCTGTSKDLLDTALVQEDSNAEETGNSDSGIVADDSATDSALPTDLHGTEPSSSIPVPEFTATNHDGTSRTSADLLGHPTVMWFFPAATTPGWTLEGCGFRDNYEAFSAIGVEIVGVSFSDVSINDYWVNDQGFQYEIWRDDNRELALYYGAADSADAWFPDRITRLLDSDGSVLLEYNSVDVGTSPANILADCLLLFGGNDWRKHSDVTTAGTIHSSECYLDKSQDMAVQACSILENESL